MPWKELEIPTKATMRALDREHPGKARFIVDESAGPEVAKILQRFGYNAQFVGELDLCGHSDEDIFAAAWQHKRILVTHDADFLDNRRFPHHRNPGVIVIRPGSDGRDDYGLLVCLSKAIEIAGSRASWFRGRKMEFVSRDLLTISDVGVAGRRRYCWPPGNAAPMIWED
jgi:predicted nuclease of predicted toxin-antitoxin system